LCRYFDVSRQGYYKAVKQVEQEVVQQQLIIELVQQIRWSSKQMGGKKLYHLLQADIHRIDASMGRDKFFELLRSEDLLIHRQRKYVSTTQSCHRFYVYGNKLLDFFAKRPHQVWVCDITYVRIRQGFVYLFLLTDGYSRKIVGWELSNSLGLEGALRALRMALRQCPVTKGLIHHSDRGFQYCCHAYTSKLKANGIEISMSAAGNCYENAMAERVNGILKGEYGLAETYADEKEARQVVREGIKAYNEQRPHWSLKLQIPAQVHEIS
jgi:putative transposase